MNNKPELVNIKPSRSAPLRFKGWCIAETEWTTNRGNLMSFEIWKTVGGSLIAVREGDDEYGNRYVDACVVEPIEPGPADEDAEPPFAMVDAVMTFFDYHDRARSMVKKQLKWSILRRVA